VKQLHDGCLRLVDYPNLGRARPELGPDIRTLLVEQHLVLYSVTDDEVLVLRVLHERRDLTDDMLE
jgi:toxin ParE1/3/4